MVAAITITVVAFAVGRWTASTQPVTILRSARGSETRAAAERVEVQPTAEIKADIAALEAEIRRTEVEDAKYSGGLVKALIAAELHTMRQTRAMLQQRAHSWLSGTRLTYTVDGKPFTPRAEASSLLGAVEAEIASTRVSLAAAEAEASRYSGGLVQALSLSTVPTTRQTIAMLEQKRLALKYDLPQYIGFQGDTPASPVSTAAQPATPRAEPRRWDVVSIESRVTESNDSWWRYAWKLTLRNDSDSQGSYDATIEFQDPDGFVIDTDREYGLFVPPHSERTFTGVAATPGPSPRSTPAREVRSGAPVSGASRTLADIARERKGKAKPSGSISGADGAIAAPALSISQGPETAAQREIRLAQERMNKASEHGLWVHKNISYNDQMKESARQEWDEAALMCHRTPGCVAVDRDKRIIPTAGVFSASGSTSAGNDSGDAYTKPRRETPTPGPELTLDDGEPYWRAKAAKARQGVRDAQHKLTEAEITTPNAGRLKPDTAAAVLAAQIRETALAPYRAALRDAEAMLKALESECSAAKQQGQFCADAWLR